MANAIAKPKVFLKLQLKPKLTTTRLRRGNAKANAKAFFHLNPNLHPNLTLSPLPHPHTVNIMYLK